MAFAAVRKLPLKIGQRLWGIGSVRQGVLGMGGLEGFAAFEEVLEMDLQAEIAAFCRAHPDDLDLTTGKVRFYPDGSSTGALIGLQIESRSWTVRVGWLTGELSVEQSG